MQGFVVYNLSPRPYIQLGLRALVRCANRRKSKLSADGSLQVKGRYRAFLFDMDGTILNSIAAAERVWSQWATRQGLDVEAFLRTIHGARAIDTITRLGLPGVDPQVEADWVSQAEVEDVEGVVEIPGAKAFLNSLPANQWAIVTSAPKALAVVRLKAAGLPIPAVFITSENVTVGKPNPDCYLIAAQKLGVDIAECLVFEDAPVGILASESAGAEVMVITTTHSHAMDTVHNKIHSYEGVSASLGEDGLIQLVL